MDIPDRLPNASVGKPYEFAVERLLSEARPGTSVEVVLPESFGLEFDGVRLHGMPTMAGEYQLSLRFRIDGGGCEEASIALTVNPDPMSLWKKLPSDPQGMFAKPDADSAALATPDLTLLAASLRGRSHAHSGAYREDDFAMEDLAATGWHILAVSDGAGSAKYSRRGSQIACQTAVGVLRGVLGQANVLDAALEKAGASVEGEEMEKLRRLSFNVFSPAAYAALQEIVQQAGEVKAVPRDFNATLILVLARRVAGRWFLASFAIGDGGAGAVLKDGVVRPLTKADGGEFAGQTLFLTTPQVYADTERLVSRAHAEFCEEFQFLAVMSDGVTDPIFPSDASFAKAETWDDLRQRLATVVNLTAPAAGMEAALLEWLNFPSPGNHDDRTVVVAIPKGGSRA